jgi:hypothetical protein
VKFEDVTPGPLGNRVYRLVFVAGEDNAFRDQFLVLMEAMAIYVERTEVRKEHWKHQGYRGPLFDIREKAERLFYRFWDAPPHVPTDKELEDALDLINYAASLVRAFRTGDRDGAWWDR